jgi:intracellular sulfur oxidation DsrE/DsrF family protein
VSRVHLNLWVCLLLALCAFARGAYAEGQYIDIAPKTQAEIQLVLDTLDATVNSHETNLPPIVMMLHGDEAHRFLRGNYAANRSLVDQTAKLAAYNVIKVQICATWMSANQYDASDLFPFVSTVPLGVAELERLSSQEAYTEFSVNL